MATFKHISSKNADYGAAEQYLTFEHDEFTMKPTQKSKDSSGRRFSCRNMHSRNGRIVKNSGTP